MACGRRDVCTCILSRHRIRPPTPFSASSPPRCVSFGPFATHYALRVSLSLLSLLFSHSLFFTVVHPFHPVLSRVSSSRILASPFRLALLPLIPALLTYLSRDVVVAPFASALAIRVPRAIPSAVHFSAGDPRVSRKREHAARSRGARIDIRLIMPDATITRAEGGEAAPAG